MKNKLILLAMTIITGLLSCTHNNSTVIPTGQNSLALVVANSDNNISSSNLLLLKDGRTTNPVSGISDFSSMNVGDKLYLTFTTGTTHDGVIDINVTKYTSAQDSVFTTTPPSENDTTTLSGTFTGIVNKASLPDSATSTQKATTSISFSGSHYTCSGTTNSYPLAGSGTFVTSGATITFTDNNTNSDTVLNGLFYYSLSQNHLNIWITRNDIFYCYSLTRK